jgi:Lysozyme like domain
MPAMPGTTGVTLTFADIEKLWTDNGGDPAWAPTMAGIAIVESGGLTNNLNNNALTKDFSVGLWQINYFGSLGPARAPVFGEPAALASDPNAQAKAAISLLGNGAGITNWAGDTVGQLAQNGKPLTLAQVTAALNVVAKGGGTTATTDSALGTAEGLAAAAADPVLGLLPGVTPGGGITGLGGFDTIVTDLASSAFWKRIGVFTLGGALLIVGGIVFFLTTKPGQDVTEVATTAALA